MTAADQTVFAPLASLYLHELNPRQTVTEAEIDDLATCLSMNGLIQNLAGLREGRAKKIGIVAGGRRLRALQALAARGEPLGGNPDWQDAIPIRLTSDPEEALRWAGAENEARVGLHPADEVRLYRGLRDKALSPGAIARAHAVTELHVRRRLRLADLPDPVIEALRLGEITLDVAQAMTVGADEAAILSILAQTRGRDVSARMVREALTRDAVRGTDRRAKFVGLDAYEAAGGRLTRDLFADDHALYDHDLLDRLFAEKLEAAAAELQAAEGWAEVRTCPDSHLPWNLDEKLRRMYRERVELPPGDEEELVRLTDMDPDSWTEAEAARVADLEARMEGSWTDDQIAQGIVYVYVGHDGAPRTGGPFTEQAPTRPRAGGGDGAEGGTPAQPETKGLSEALRMDLIKIRTGALQAALIEPDNLDLLLAIIAAELDMASYDRMTEVHLRDAPTRPTIDEALSLPDSITEIPVPGTGPADPDRLEAMLDGERAFLDRLQLALARTVGARPDAYGRAVEKLAGADIRAHWRPTAANFFARVPAAYLDRVAEAVLPDRIGWREEFGAMKKAGKAAELDRLFRLDDDTVAALGLSDDEIAAIRTWLPEEMT